MEHSTQIKPASRPAGRSPRTALIAGVLLFAILLVAGILPRLKRNADLTAVANEQQQSALLATVATPRAGEAVNEIALPATTQAIQDTILYAKTGGTVRRWYAGLGQHVKAGQLLLELDIAYVGQELNEARQQATEAGESITQATSGLAQAQAALEQAEAALKQARTNLQLAKLNRERADTLVAQGVVSRQEADDKQAVFEAREADVEAAQATVRVRQAALKTQQSEIDLRQSTRKAREANVGRLAEQQAFQRVTAPYDGIITARNIEVGARILENGATGTGLGLYRITKQDVIRVFTSVPQTYAPAMHAGLPVTMKVKELPERTFTGQVFGTAHIIDPASRTMMVEVRFPNRDGQLLPGMYAEVVFSLPAPQRTLLIPASALVANAEGTQVLIARPDQTVHIVKVVLGRDLGKEIEVVNGLDGNETVITNPTDAFREGVRVQVDKAHK
ncbi:MAG: efflux RND transporter periplasmic adaptor subunit [Acidobacteria bacterium]|nr:efflux RND transporter periplasmic adaptor subunit [Acidobacteriota bacterium]MBI3426644.1 efflux RND transporter periplasmic adaptor subunit [Acidobacteriota bacterium]